MKVRLFFILFFISFSFFMPIRARSQGEVLLKERAVYRLNNRVLYLSEVRPYARALETFRCFKGEKLLLRSVGFDEGNLSSVPSLPSDLKGLNQHRDFLDGLLKLLMASSYASRFSVSMGAEDFLKMFAYKGCVQEKEFKKWPDELRSLVQSEAYYRQRFIPRKQRLEKTVSTTAVEELRKFIDGLSEKYDQGVFFGD